MKMDLLSSFDTLASHLVTTFSALSTALATCSTSESIKTSRVYMAILVGPSLGTAKSKVIYGVDNFATRVWGTRNDQLDGDEDDGDGSGEECPKDSEDDESSEDACSEGTESEDAVSDNDVEGDENAEDEEERKADEELGEEQEEREEQQEEEEKQKDPTNGHPPPFPTLQSYAEEQRFLQAADRLLARALASADAEGHGISNEMCKLFLAM